MFRKLLGKREIKNSSKSVLQIFFKKIGSKRDSPNSKFFEPYKRNELRMPSIIAHTHVTPCIACEKARVALGLNTCLKRQ